jgi:hypothetical protein
MDATPVVEVEAPAYPEWQKTIRQGQAYVAELVRQEQAHYDEQEAAKQAELGKLLAQALSHFGIKADPVPTTNSFQLDKIAFEFSDQNGGTKPSLYNRPGELHYGLHVRYVLDAKYQEHMDSYDLYSNINFVRVRQAEDDDWSETHAAMAEAIDGVTRYCLDFMAHFEERQAQLEAIPDIPTSAEQLVALIREIATAAYSEF